MGEASVACLGQTLLTLKITRASPNIHPTLLKRTQNRMFLLTHEPVLRLSFCSHNDVLKVATLFCWIRHLSVTLKPALDWQNQWRGEWCWKGHWRGEWSSSIWFKFLEDTIPGAILEFHIWWIQLLKHSYFINLCWKGGGDGSSRRSGGPFFPYDTVISIFFSLIWGFFSASLNCSVN